MRWLRQSLEVEDSLVRAVKPAKFFWTSVKKTLAGLLKTFLYNPNVLNRCAGKVQAPVMGFTYLLNIAY